MEYKLGVLGSGGVGKSAITIQFIQNHFIEEYDPTIEDSYRKQLTVDGEMCLADVLDTAGQEEYSAMRDRYMRTIQGFILVYSVTDRHSFEEIHTFVEHAMRVKDVDEICCVLIANKCDLLDSRVVTTEEGKALANKFNCPYFETSAKERINIDELFWGIIRRCRDSGFFYNYSNNGRRNKRSKKNSLFSRIYKGSNNNNNNNDNTHNGIHNVTKLYKPSPQVTPIVIPESIYVKDFKTMYEDMDFADVRFHTNDDQIVLAHKVVISARCRELWTIIVRSSSETIDLDVTSAVLNLVLRYLYTGNFVEISAEIDENAELRHQLLTTSRTWKIRELYTSLTEKYQDLGAPSDPSVLTQEMPEPLLTKSEASLPSSNREMRRAFVASSSDKPTYDVIFRLKNDEAKPIRAHKAILSARCAYFRAMFTGGTKERTADEVKIEDETPLPVFMMLIEYCYTDDVRYIRDDMVVDLLLASSKYCLLRLKRQMENYILRGVTQHNALEVYRLATDNDANELSSQCVIVIANWLNTLKKTKEFTALLSPAEIAACEDMRSQMDSNNIEEERVAVEKAKVQVVEREQTEKCGIQ